MMTAQKGINLPRYASLPNIMKAKRKPLSKKTAADLGVAEDQVGTGAAMTAIVSVAPPPERKAGIIVEGDTAADKAAELVRLLREEAKAL
jgi:electron transfer flavoprotein beta subunit